MAILVGWPVALSGGTCRSGCLLGTIWILGWSWPKCPSTPQNISSRSRRMPIVSVPDPSSTLCCTASATSVLTGLQATWHGVPRSLCYSFWTVAASLSAFYYLPPVSRNCQMNLFGLLGHDFRMFGEIWSSSTSSVAVADCPTVASEVYFMSVVFGWSGGDSRLRWWRVGHNMVGLSNSALILW